MFENQPDWTKAAIKPCETKGKLTCEIGVELDAHTATLIINNQTMMASFSESFTSISHIGFGTHSATTRFTLPKQQ